MPSAPRDAFKATVSWSMLGAFGGGSGFPAKQRVSAPGPLASSVRCFCRHEACTGRLCHCRELGRACQCGFSHRKSVLISSRPRQCTPCRAHARFLGDRKKSGLCRALGQATCRALQGQTPSPADRPARRRAREIQNRGTRVRANRAKPDLIGRGLVSLHGGPSKRQWIVQREIGRAKLALDLASRRLDLRRSTCRTLPILSSLTLSKPLFYASTLIRL